MPPGRLLLQTAGACDFDPEHLVDVFGEQRQRFIMILRDFGPGDWAAPTRCTAWSAHDELHGFWDSWLHERDVLLARGAGHPTDGDATGYAAGYGLFIAAAVASMFGARLQEKLTLGGDGGGVFELDSIDGLALSATSVTTPAISWPGTTG